MKRISLFLAVFFRCLGFANALYVPPFDLDYCVGEAKVIIRGKRNQQGDIEITEFLSKSAEISPSFKLYDGDMEYKCLQKMVGGSGSIDVLFS